MLEITWFILWGLLWAIYFVLDGFDLGLGTLMPFIAGNDAERRIVYNCAGPFWDGNEVWLITAGGVTFAAFPTAYAVMFSALYAPLLILLFGLILRAVSFEFRNKVDSPRWRRLCDRAHFFGNAVPALLLGVAFSNLFLGIPIDADGVNQGSILTLLNPYGLVGGILFVFFFCLHGALWLAFKSTAALRDRGMRWARNIWPWVLGISVLYLLMTYTYTGIFDNYAAHPTLFLLPLLAVACLIAVRIMLSCGEPLYAWACNAGYIALVTLFGVTGMFPSLVPSSLNPEWDITIAKAASSPLTLKIMLGVALVLVPVVIAYQVWVYHTFSHKVTEDELASGKAYY
jgi:cytochrome d ubiquinol oxidase subunit II